MKIADIHSAYCIGIKGVGMAAFAQILQAKGVSVSGSDTQEVFFTDEVLRSLNIPFVEGFSATNIPDKTDVVITSPAYLGSDNPEIVEAQKRGLPVISWHEGLAELFNSNTGIAVCGTHGKSTTTGMLGAIVEHAGLDPTVMVGSRVNQWGSNARVGKSEYYIIEADEYRNAFLHYNPKIIVVTNIEYDHPDFFPTPDSYAMSFKKFMDRVDDENLVRTPSELQHFNLKIPGEYNQRNANAAYEVALKLGIDADIAREALENFEGLARRFESYGSSNGALLYDDYAHHPSELRALLQGAREKFPSKKITFLFQPHTFSRTERLFDDFVSVLLQTDCVGILRTYGSARERGEDEIGKRLAGTLKAPYFSDADGAVEHFSRTLDANTVLFSVGAGDGWHVLEMMRKS